MKNNKKNYSNTELNQIRGGLARYFGHNWDFIESENVRGKVGKKRKWATEKRFALDSVTLLRRFLEENELVGVRFKSSNGFTNYLMADIDTKGAYHPLVNPAPIETIKQAIEDMGLGKQIFVQSSDSGGLHIFVSLSRQMDVFTAACWFEMAMRNAGLELAPGQLELFPNTKHWQQGKPSLYRAHNLPLQPNSGSYLLNAELEPISDNILDFIHEMDFAAKYKNIVTDEMLADAQAAREAITIERKVFTGNGKPNSKKLKEWEKDLQYYVQIGWTGAGQTNKLLIKFGAYGVVFLGLVGEELVNHIINTARAAIGYKEHCGHQHEIERRAREVARSVSKYYWKLGGVAKRSCTYRTMTGETVIANGNEAKTLNTMERLEAVLNHIRTHRLTVTNNTRAFLELINKISQKLFKVGISSSTLYSNAQYKSVWRTAFAALAVTVTVQTSPVEAQEVTPIEIVEAQAVTELTTQQIEQQAKVKITPETTPESAEKPPLETEEKTEENTPLKNAETRRNIDCFGRCAENPEPKRPEPAETLAVSDVVNVVFVDSLSESADLENLNFSSAVPEFSKLETINKSYTQNSDGNGLLTYQENLSFKPPEPPAVRSPKDFKQLAQPQPKRSPQAVAEQAYYQALLKRHPHLNALEDYAKSPDGQIQAKEAFRRIRGILDRVRGKSSHRNEPPSTKT